VNQRVGDMNHRFLFICLFAGFFSLDAKALISKTPNKEFLQQTFAGYQGWFSTQKLSKNGIWTHWNAGQIPSVGQIKFELYPDVREYNADDLQETGLGVLGNGQPSMLFASDRAGVVDTHFRWMKEYGIDGVALQRFVSELNLPFQKMLRDDVAVLVRQNAQKYDRSFYMEYDITSSNEATLVSDIKKDWLELETKVLDSPQYAKHKGRPVIALWGFGYTDRPGTQEQALELIRWFHEKGFMVIGGVPYWWRQGINNSKANWLSTYLKFDMVQPWSVGVYASALELLNNHVKMHIDDKKLCDQYNVLYQRVIFPGFAWSNWNGGKFNMIPRAAGDLFWAQAYWTKKLGVSAFIAMFDEYDESTAIAKAAENASMSPVSQKFLTLDADGKNISSDFYLRVAGDITKLLRGEKQLTACLEQPYRLPESRTDKFKRVFRQKVSCSGIVKCLVK